LWEKLPGESLDLITTRREDAVVLASPSGFVTTEAVGSIHLARNDEERNLALRRTADDTTEAERTVWGLGEKLVRTFRHCKRTVQFFVPYLRSS
jgi:hypothetical protein